MTRNCHVPFCRAVGEATLLLTLIIKVAGGQSETLNGRGGKRETTAKVAASREASTQRSVVQLSLFDL
jgi:putative transposase